MDSASVSMRCIHGHQTHATKTVGCLLSSGDIPARWPRPPPVLAGGLDQMGRALVLGGTGLVDRTVASRLARGGWELRAKAT